MAGKRGTNGNVILTTKHVDQIRALHSIGLGGTTISKMFSVHKSTVHLLVSRTTWKHIPDPEALEMDANWSPEFMHEVTGKFLDHVAQNALNSQAEPDSVVDTEFHF
jgi:hypothetical protein